MTFREAIDQAQARVDRARAELERAERDRDDLIVRALTAGASFREMARELNIAPSTVLARYGHKGSTRGPGVLDLPPPRRQRKAATGPNAPARGPS